MKAVAAENFFYLGTIVTDSIEGSTHEFFIDLDRICENMTNAEFRNVLNDARGEAIRLVDARVAALITWDDAEKARVFQWFGCSDDAIREKLREGLARVASILRNLSPANVVRTGSGADRATGCTPNPLGQSQEAAHVCAPDTATHTISISPRFCTMRQSSGSGDSRVSTLIHEASHFLDTMATTDEKYTVTRFLRDWGQQNPALAVRNADSIAGYCVYGD
ncbi:Peptidase M35 [Burkholderia sp. 8Y]|uniref:M35 family metallo-endopeptidase n=1 Tax=Burkholderia sp. 8Y TaxID=2653133 RepID=UPI0012F3CA8D|nr:M35 family metallo-endopeptidase [Burkholderia sp. 8Y]VXC53923.1 Peptidase M35 [Burkholderia sp. 8Y]